MCNMNILLMCLILDRFARSVSTERKAIQLFIRHVWTFRKLEMTADVQISSCVGVLEITKSTDPFIHIFQ